MTADLAAPALPRLDPEDRRTLLRMARQAIGAAIAGRPLPALECPAPALESPAGVFVSLHQGEQLRGCIGSLAATQPLWMAVARMAVAAASEDPRFPPLSAVELGLIEIEISRLGPLQPVRAEDIVAGRHGVCLECGGGRAVFLPQVASRYGWDRQKLLEQLCLKAMLPPGAWSYPDAVLLVFEAEVFGERE